GLDDQQEAAWIRRLVQLLCAHGETTDPRSVIFLDTETTGLSGGAGTVAFLVGVGRWSGSGFIVEQYLMRDYNEERAMLLGLRESLADAQMLVTFNGKAFDIPLLQSRFVLARQRWPLAGTPHLDLLHPARRIWKLRLGSCSLANLESQILGIERENDIPGHLIPQVYFQYVRTHSAHGIGNILSHNRQDIETLARLTLRMGEIFFGQAGEELAPVDLFSAGRYAYALGERELAVRWNEAALLRGLPEDREVEAKKAKAARLKEQKKYSEAAELWRDLSERSQAFLEDVQEELAIYHEHRKGDLEEALNLSERALAHLQDKAAQRKWRHRRDRVAMKLARRKPIQAGSLFHIQN
ncbi:MAG TPA: ribonuclease H-like domain-containing protein, partial [Terriglobia bacterium]|nr:ribonuclease H-like domain-containing protein [Terriglobia bacterium]